MVKVRVPLRISIAGGGTDLPGYYEQHGGLVLSTTIDKYIYISLSRGSYKDRAYKVLVQGNVVSDTDHVGEISNNIIKGVIQMVRPTHPLIIDITSDLEGSSGMGSSGALTVGLLLAFEILERPDYVLNQKARETLAENAFAIERYLLGQPVGKQDQYMAAYGGPRALLISRNGQVWPHLIPMHYETLHILEKRLVLFDTGLRRDASPILQQVEGSTHTKDIHTIAADTLQGFRLGLLDPFGLDMDRHWTAKKKITPNMTNSFIDTAYDRALIDGALGGKIIGAGGGGFLLLYVPMHRSVVIEEQEKLGLKHIPFKFSRKGVEVINGR